MVLPLSNLLDTDSASDGVSLSFGSWRSPNSSRPVLVQVSYTIDPTGTTEAELALDVDEDGGTTADYTFNRTAAAGLGASRQGSWFAYIPAGGGYQVRNVSDPDSGNTLNNVREWVL